MKKTLLVIVALLVAGTSFAQSTTAVSSTGMKPGSVLSELESAIDPRVFLKSFDREAWKKNLDNIANPYAFGRALTDLAFGLSPEAFNNDWSSKQNVWLSKAKGLSKYSDAKSMLTEFESYLNPKMLSPDWANKKATWLKSLETLQ